MLELGLTPFDPQIKKFTPVHWYIFYYVIKEKESNFFERLCELLGIRIGKRNFIPFGYVINPEVMKELEKITEMEKLKEEEDEYKDMSYEELKFVLEEIEKEVKKAEDKSMKKEW